jgi:copper(I)-binding protein
MRFGIAVVVLGLGLTTACSVSAPDVPQADTVQGSAQVGDLRVSDAYISVPPGKGSGIGTSTTAHLLLTDSGSDADTLTSGSSPVASSVQFVSFGQLQPQVAVPSGADGIQVTAQLIDLSESLRTGQRVPLTLQFTGAGSVTVSVPVQ